MHISKPTEEIDKSWLIWGNDGYRDIYIRGNRSRSVGHWTLQYNKNEIDDKWKLIIELCQLHYIQNIQYMKVNTSRTDTDDSREIYNIHIFLNPNTISDKVHIGYNIMEEMKHYDKLIYFTESDEFLTDNFMKHKISLEPPAGD